MRDGYTAPDTTPEFPSHDQTSVATRRLKGAKVDVRVHGKNMQIGDALRELTEAKVAHAGRIFGDEATADVEFTESQNPRVSDGKYRVEITAPVAGHVLRVEASAHDERTALDLSYDKFERQLRRLKERLIQRSRKSSNKLLNAPPEEAEEVGENIRPLIARSKQFAMKPMMPEEAALQMELLGHTFFFFLNGESDSYAVLYQRRDGSLGLIEPT